MKRISLVLASLFIGGLSAGAFAQPTVTSTATGGANHSAIGTFQLNANLPSSTQLPINLGGNQQAAAVNNQNANQANQNSIGNAAAAASLTSGAGAPVWVESIPYSSTGTSASAGNQSYQGNYTPTHIHQGAFFGD